MLYTVHHMLGVTVKVTILLKFVININNLSPKKPKIRLWNATIWKLLCSQVHRHPKRTV